jgi:hypothetical protein
MSYIVSKSTKTSIAAFVFALALAECIMSVS